MSVRLLVSDYELGDSNGDGIVTIADATNTTSYILGQNPYRFIFDAADINRDNQITVADVAGTVDIILNAPASSNAMTRNSAATTIETISVENACITAGRNNVIALQLSNANRYSALQTEIYLPEGLHLVSASNHTEESRNSNHLSAWSQLGDGMYRIVSYSLSNQSFVPVDGNVIYLTVWADEDAQLGDATIEFNATRIATDQSEEFVLGAVQASIAIMPTSIENTLTDGMQIYAHGKYLHIRAAVDGTVRMISTNGIQRLINVKQGDNQFYIDTDGVYIINHQKIVIQ